MLFIMLYYPEFHLAVLSACGGLLGYGLINQEEVTDRRNMSPRPESRRNAGEESQTRERQHARKGRPFIPTDTAGRAEGGP